jgi:hypothetical protein
VVELLVIFPSALRQWMEAEAVALPRISIDLRNSDPWSQLFRIRAILDDLCIIGRHRWGSCFYELAMRLVGGSILCVLEQSKVELMVIEIRFIISAGRRGISSNLWPRRLTK